MGEVRMTEEAKRIIERAIKSPEFIDGLVEGTHLLDCVKKVCDNKNPYALESLKRIIENRICELNTQYWFERMNKLI